jgi:hypothetical protein
MPLVERVVDCCHQMPDERKHIAPKLLDFTSLAPEEMAKRMKPTPTSATLFLLTAHRF